MNATTLPPVTMAQLCARNPSRRHRPAFAPMSATPAIDRLLSRPPTFAERCRADAAAAREQRQQHLRRLRVARDFPPGHRHHDAAHALLKIIDGF